MSARSTERIALEEAAKPPLLCSCVCCCSCAPSIQSLSLDLSRRGVLVMAWWETLLLLLAALIIVLELVRRVLYPSGSFVPPLAASLVGRRIVLPYDGAAVTAGTLVPSLALTLALDV